MKGSKWGLIKVRPQVQILRCAAVVLYVNVTTDAKSSCWCYISSHRERQQPEADGWVWEVPGAAGQEPEAAGGQYHHCTHLIVVLHVCTNLVPTWCEFCSLSAANSVHMSGCFRTFVALHFYRLLQVYYITEDVYKPCDWEQGPSYCDPCNWHADILLTEVVVCVSSWTIHSSFARLYSSISFDEEGSEGGLLASESVIQGMHTQCHITSGKLSV